jgi:opacity protein-like surface antigen
MHPRTSQPAIHQSGSRRVLTRIALRWNALTRIAALLALALAASIASAQVVPSAYRQAKSLWIGAEYSNVNASFPYQSNQRLSGIGVFADFNWNGHIGVEADARFLHFGNFYGETESSYLAGPRYLFPQWHHLQPYAKTLIGIGRIHYPFQIGDASYLAIAPGAGVNYRISHRWTVRGEYEYQLWPDSPGFSNRPSHELTPHGFHLGLAYRPFH